MYVGNNLVGVNGVSIDGGRYDSATSLYLKWQPLSESQNDFSSRVELNFTRDLDAFISFPHSL